MFALLEKFFEIIQKLLQLAQTCPSDVFNLYLQIKTLFSAKDYLVMVDTCLIYSYKSTLYHHYHN